MALRQSTIQNRRMRASDKGTAPGRDAKMGRRLAAIEQEIAGLRASLEAQAKRVQTIQAQLDHLTARAPI
jgi:hypothetical protein